MSSTVVNKPADERKQYDPADVYSVVIDKQSEPAQIVDLLFQRLTPFLPIHVLTGKVRGQRIEDMIRLVDSLKDRYRDILCGKGLGVLALHVSASKLPDLPWICSNIEDPKLKAEVFEELMREQEAMTPKFLACLGFLPTDVLPEKLSRRTDGKNREVAALKATFSQTRLDHWEAEVSRDFGECLVRGFAYVGDFPQKIIPHSGGLDLQEFESLSDLNTQTFASLLIMALNDGLTPQRRFEAFRTLEWAVSCFSVMRNPVHSLQLKVRRRLDGILASDIWHGSAKCKPWDGIPSAVTERVYREELPDDDAASAGRKDKKTMVARSVRKEVRAILDIPEIGSPSSVVFKGRGKELEPTALKIMLRREMYRKCRACSAGLRTDLENGGGPDAARQYAESKLNEMREIAVRNGLPRNLFDIKPVGLNSLDDNVGCAFVVNLAKPLDDFTDQEIGAAGECLQKFAQFVAEKLGLRNVRIENYLRPGGNGGNKKTSGRFRLIKLHGDYEIEGDVFDRGLLRNKKMQVPVEIQFMPFETHLRDVLAGETGHRTYDKRRTRDIWRLTFPHKIGDVGLYPFVKEVSAGEMAEDLE